jgi:Flp pilus assembly pilin Flp
MHRGLFPICCTETPQAVGPPEVLKSARIHSIRSNSQFDKQSDTRHDGLSRTHPPEVGMSELLHRLFVEDEGQDIAEYAVMLAVILVLVVGTIRLIGTNANTAFSSVASSIP